MNLEEGDVILCTIKRIQGTTVFLETPENIEGTMIFSEVSPGRIRNIRDFVTINKKVVCKVLRIKNGHPELSLRRVTAKEREEVLETDKKEKMLTSMLKTVFKDETPKVLEKIKTSLKNTPADFLDEARENPELLKKISSGKQLTLLEKIFLEKKEKEKEVKKIISVKTNSSDGIEKIKSLLKEIPEAEISYKGSSNFYISVKAKDFKTANHNLEEILNKLKQKAKELGVQLEIK